jgi:hypothetical protein
MTGTRVPDREKTEEMSGENPRAEARAPVFFYICVSRSPSLALEVTRDFDKEDRRVGRRGNDLGTGLTGCGGGMRRERPGEAGFLASLSPPIFGKTEITGELE